MNSLDNKRIGKAAAWAALGMVLLSFPLRYTSPQGEFHHDLTSAVLALELADTQSEVDAIFPVDSASQTRVRDALLHNTEWDLSFILVYAAFFWMVTGSIARAGLQPIVRGLILVTAAADYVEDLGIFHTVETSQMVAYTHIASLIKWAGLSVILLLIALQLAKTRLRPFERTFTGLLAILVFLAGVTGLTGLWNSPESFLAGIFSYRHLTLTVSLAGILPVAYLIGAFVGWRGVVMQDSPPIVPLTDDPPQILGPHT